MKTKKTPELLIIIDTICVMMLIWFVLSWVDVIRHNSLGDESYKYHTFNFFNIFEEEG